MEKKLQKAINQQMPNPDDMIESLWNTPVTPLPFADEIVRQDAPEETNKNSGILKGFALSQTNETKSNNDDKSNVFVRIKEQFQAHAKVAYSVASIALLLAIGGGFYQTQYKSADSLVSIDVNPSIELTTNKKDQVLKIAAKNTDAQDIIDEMQDYKNKDVDIVVEVFLDNLQEHGYLQDDENIILVSVSNKKAEKTQTLQNRIEKEIDNNMKKTNKKAVVIKQDVEKVSELKKLAKKYHISVGKLQFIQKIIAINPSLKLKDLAKMSMKELNKLARQYGIFSDNSIHTNEIEEINETQEFIDSPVEDTEEGFSVEDEVEEESTEDFEQDSEESDETITDTDSEIEDPTQTTSGDMDTNDTLPGKNDNIAPSNPDTDLETPQEETTQTAPVDAVNEE